MVSPAARSTTAATLVFIASVLLIAPDAPLWCVAIALGAAAWRILVAIGFILTFHVFHFTLLSKLLPPLLDVDVSTGPTSPPQIGPQEITTDG